jgi:hypothetical protein
MIGLGTESLYETVVIVEWNSVCNIAEPPNNGGGISSICAA